MPHTKALCAAPDTHAGSVTVASPVLFHLFSSKYLLTTRCRVAGHFRGAGPQGAGVGG